MDVGTCQGVVKKTPRWITGLDPLIAVGTEVPKTVLFAIDVQPSTQLRFKVARPQIETVTAE